MCSVASNVTKLCAKRDLIPQRGQEEIKRERNYLLGRTGRKACFISFDLSSRADLAKGGQSSTRSLDKEPLAEV